MDRSAKYDDRKDALQVKSYSRVFNFSKLKLIYRTQYRSYKALWLTLCVTAVAADLGIFHLLAGP